MSSQSRFMSSPRKIIDQIYDVSLGCWSPFVSCKISNKKRNQQTEFLSPPSIEFSKQYKECGQTFSCKPTLCTEYETPKLAVCLSGKSTFAKNRNQTISDLDFKNVYLNRTEKNVSKQDILKEFENINTFSSKFKEKLGIKKLEICSSNDSKESIDSIDTAFKLKFSK